MAKFTAPVPLNIRLPGGFEIVGAPGATHRIPDSLVEEFERDNAPGIPGGVTWITQDETSGVSGFDPSLKYDKTGGTISGAVTVTGALVAQSAATVAGALVAQAAATVAGALVAQAAATVAGALVAQSSVSTPAMTADRGHFKGNPWYDVKAYGAVGDGTTNDRVAIQNALDAAHTANGGTIYFPAGTYFISGAVLTAYTGTHLLGIGRSGIQFSSWPGPTLLSGVQNGILVTDGTDDARSAEFSLKGLRFKWEGSSAGDGSHILVDLRYGGFAQVRDCIFDGTSRGGVYGLRLFNFGQVGIKDCLFQDFPQHTTESLTRPAIEISTTTSSQVGGYPQQAITIEDTMIAYCGRGIDLHNRSGVAGDGLHMLRINGLFVKKSGAVPWGTDVSRGVSCNGEVRNLSITNAKFEDVYQPLTLVGKHIVVDNILIDHASTGIEVGAAEDVEINRISLSSYTNNPIEIGVHVSSAATGPVALRNYDIFGSYATTTVILSNDAGQYGEPLGIAPLSGAGPAGASTIGAANRCVYVPMRVEQATRIDSVQVFINTAGSSSGTFALAIFDAMTSVRLATSTAIGNQTTGRRTISLSSSVTLKPGLYYLALSCNENGGTFGVAGNDGTYGLGVARFQETAHPPPSTMAPSGTTSVTPALFANSVSSYL